MTSKPTRRKFFMGAATLAAPLAISAAAANDDTAARLAALEDTSAIRALLRQHAQRVNAGADLAPGPNVRSLALDADIAVDIADGTAIARAACSVDTATPIDGCETLIEMARLQGEGVIKDSERRLLKSSFVKRDGQWHLLNAEFQA